MRIGKFLLVHLNLMIFFNFYLKQQEQHAEISQVDVGNGDVETEKDNIEFAQENVLEVQNCQENDQVNVGNGYVETGNYNIEFAQENVLEVQNCQENDQGNVGNGDVETGNYNIEVAAVQTIPQVNLDRVEILDSWRTTFFRLGKDFRLNIGNCVIFFENQI